MVIGALHALTCKYRHKSFSLFTQSNPYYRTKEKKKDFHSCKITIHIYTHTHNNIRHFFSTFFVFVTWQSLTLPYIMRILC